MPTQKKPRAVTGAAHQWYILGLGYALGRLHAGVLAGTGPVDVDYAGHAEDFGQQVARRFQIKHLDQTRVAGELAACWHEFSHGVPLVPVVPLTPDQERAREQGSAEAFYEGLNEHRH